MFIADAHCDFLSKAAKGADFYNPKDGQHISKQSLKNANIKFITFAAFGGKDEGFPSKKAFISRQIECYKALVKPQDRINSIPFTDAWCCLSFEGLDWVEKVEDMATVLNNRPLTAGILWNNANALGGSCKEDMPLTSLGKNAVKMLSENSIAVDLAHAGEKTFYDVFEITERPFVSHANCYGIHNHKRNLKDAQIKLLISRGSFIGITLYADFIGENADISTLFKHINRILDMGGEDILGFGSDFDGCEDLVNGAKDTKIYLDIISEMARQNFPQRLIYKLTHENYKGYLSHFEQKINTCF